jgi:hypothetical protein
LTLVLPLVVVVAAPIEFIGETHRKGRAVSESTTFRDCRFLDCVATGQQNGGALHCGDPLVDLGVLWCIFAHGWRDVRLAVSQLLDVGCIRFELHGRFRGRFLPVWIYSTQSGEMFMTETSAHSCQSPGTAMEMSSEVYASGLTTRLRSLNSSANWGSASGISAFWHFNLALSFSIFRNGNRASCVILGYLMHMDIYCLCLRNNSCYGPINGGLMRVISCSLIIMTSVFEENRFDYFVGTSPDAPGAIAFVGCFFDIDALNTTHSVVWAVEARARSRFLCRTPTPVPTRTATNRPDLTYIGGDLCPMGHVELETSTVVLGCSSKDITAIDDGAIAMESHSADLWINGCAFSKCRAERGSAVFAHCSLFSMRGALATTCSAWGTGPFGHVAAMLLQLDDSVVVGGHATPAGTMWVLGNGSAQSVNVTRNEVTEAAATMLAKSDASMSVRFAVVEANGNANCLTSRARRRSR